MNGRHMRSGAADTVDDALSFDGTKTDTRGRLRDRVPADSEQPRPDREHCRGRCRALRQEVVHLQRPVRYFTRPADCIGANHCIVQSMVNDAGRAVRVHKCG